MGIRIQSKVETTPGMARYGKQGVTLTATFQTGGEKLVCAYVMEYQLSPVLDRSGYQQIVLDENSEKNTARIHISRRNLYGQLIHITDEQAVSLMLDLEKTFSSDSAVQFNLDHSFIQSYNSFPAPSRKTLDELLIKYKLDREGVNPSIDTALRRAAVQGNTLDVKTLVEEYGADVHGKSSNGKTALDWARQKAHHGTVTFLSTFSDDANQTTGQCPVQ